MQRIYLSYKKGAIFKEHPYIEIGKKVLIKEGPFVGLTGFVTDTKDKVILRIRFLRKAVSITVDPGQIEVLD